MGDLGVQVSVCPFVRPSTFTQSVLWAQLLTILYQSFWNFAGVFIMVWGCACGFGYNCKIIFYHLFHFVNLVIFRPQCIDSGYLVSATPHTIFWNFAHVFFMVRRCACDLDVILALIFPLGELFHFLTSGYMKVLWQWVPCERNSSYNFIPIFLKLCTCYLHGQKMCIWFGCNPCINFCHFFHFVNFQRVWGQKMTE